MKHTSILRLSALLLTLFTAPLALADHNDHNGPGGPAGPGWDNANRSAGIQQIIARLDAGYGVTAYLDYNVGTLAAGQPYNVTYNRYNQTFTTSGWSLSRNAYNTQTYYSNVLYQGAVSLWGAVFYFDDFGNLYYRGQQYAGRLQF